MLSALVLALAAPASAARPRALPAAADLAVDFKALARQRPWTCAVQPAIGVPPAGWAAVADQCAWQNRLRMRRWSGPVAAKPGACVSAQAQWWAWARGAAPAAGTPAAGTPAAWRTTWATQSIIDERGAEKRIVIARRLKNGEWSATEWRWNPSPRAATRAWQEGRWKLLAERAAQLRAPAEAAQGAPQARMLRAVLEANLGTRAGEIGERGWRWQGDGLCLAVDEAGLGQQIMQLPYSSDDSRLEQRAAMQLQLARRYPRATWLTNFSLVPTSPNERGGAKFYAIWTEQATLKGQLWIPTRGNGPLVRLRLTAALPGVAAEAPAVARAEQAMQRELMALASRWAAQHE
ncbi:hypothetical protein CR105_06285 [Massilia eurypsychrophila]|uniref:Uncharacterized protein n=1 Tax=Massilia eurypsychrophila TaxID=1485217 RepID=A0A2G8TI13_9BURK|nr:hypothetical protein [Massilia eurypsychrophila]PIL45682.1 hypothetical protein CR105_06285 [Massilia eurypsychrophila]